MSQKLKLIGLGMAAGLADNAGGIGGISNTQTATGSSSQTGSFALANDFTVFTTAASNSGGRFPSGTPGDVMGFCNADGNTMIAYPPVGGALNGGSANAGINVATHLSCIGICIDGLNWALIVSA